MAIDVAAIDDGLAMDDRLDGNVTFVGTMIALLLLVVVADDGVDFCCCFRFPFSVWCLGSGCRFVLPLTFDPIVISFFFFSL